MTPDADMRLVLVDLKRRSSTGALRALYGRLIGTWGPVGIDDVRLLLPDVQALQTVGEATAGDVVRLRRAIADYDVALASE